MTHFREIPANKRSKAYRRLVYGIGINDADYLVTPTINGKQEKCPYYTVWNSMLKRCYDKKHHKKNPTYKNCTVSSEWIYFLVFKEWMERQNWKGKELDKDIITPGNKIYSARTCVFVSHRINVLLINKAKNKPYQKGVFFDKKSKKFIATCNAVVERKYLGSYLTEEGASKAYRAFKSELITVLANNQTDIRIKTGLLKHAELIK